MITRTQALDPALLATAYRVAVGYVRQSSAKQDGTEASPQEQRNWNRKKSEELGCQFLRNFEDIGVSGWDPDARRDGFEAMLSLARKQAFDVLIVPDVSRFSRREIADAIPVVTELHRLGITIVSVLDGVFAPGDTMAFIYLIMRLEAGFKESQNKSSKVRDIKAAQREKGSWLGGQTPYGLTGEKYLSGKLPLMRLVHVPEEAENLRHVWATIKEHMNTPTKTGKVSPGSISGICTDMNQRNVPTRGRNKKGTRPLSLWTTRTLKGILRNPAIAGIRAETVYKERKDGISGRTVEGYRIRRDEDGRPEMMCEPIIPVAEWFELQEWLDTRIRGAGLSRNVSLLSGLRTMDHKPVLTCECGRSMSGMGGSLNGRTKPAYRCSREGTTPTVPGEHQGRNTITQSHLDDYIARRVIAQIQAATAPDPETEVLLMVRAATAAFSAAHEPTETSHTRRDLVAEHNDASAGIKALYDDLEDGLYDGLEGRARFKRSKARIEQRIETSANALMALSEPRTVELPFGEWLHPGDDGDPIGDGSWWHGASREDRRTLVSLFVRRIVVAKATERYRGSSSGYRVDSRVAVEWVMPEMDEDDQLELV